MIRNFKLKYYELSGFAIGFVLKLHFMLRRKIPSSSWKTRVKVGKAQVIVRITNNFNGKIYVEFKST